MYIYAVFMLLIITIGVPCLYATLLYLNRRKIDPPAKDEMTKQRMRSQDESLAHISFLYKEYRSSCLYMEPAELLRRAFMVGIVGFCGEGAATQSAAGLLVALLFVFVYRELQPFNDRLNSLLADIAMWMCFIVFACAFIIETRPFGYDDNALGGMLLTFFLFVVACAVWCAMQDSAEQTELRQRQCELVFREVEADMDITELRADIQQLRETYEPQQLEKERKASEIQDFSGRRSSIQLNTMISAPVTAKDKKSEISFFNVQYPCYVLSINRLREHDRLPVHEDALRAEKLDILTSTSLMPSSAFTYFISQNWETFGDEPHPDNTRNTKLNWLKQLPRHMKLPGTVTEVWVWWDRASIPQRARAEQQKAIDSLCCFCQLCSRFIPLVRDVDGWKQLYQEDITHPEFPTAGALETYAARGWCRLEILCGLAPKKFTSGGWRPGPRNMRFRFHHDPSNAGIGPMLTSNMLRNPIDGNFTVDSDRATVVPVLKLIAERFAEYAQSGSDAWDATLDVHKRPKWLKQLAGVVEGVPEAPHVDPRLQGAASLNRLFRPDVQAFTALTRSKSSSAQNASKVLPIDEESVLTPADGDSEPCALAVETTDVMEISRAAPGSDYGASPSADCRELTTAVAMYDAPDEEQKQEALDGKLRQEAVAE